MSAAPVAPDSAANESQPLTVSFPEDMVADLRARLGSTRWPDQPAGLEWELGTDLAYLRELCSHWAEEYDFDGFAARLNQLPSFRWRGLHFIHARAGGEGLPILLVHGWPGGPIEFSKLCPLLVEAGHDVVVPSLPGYAWSDIPEAPLNVAGVAARLHELMTECLGYRRYVVQGGDWGAPISARLAFAHPDAVAACHLNSVGVLPAPGNLEDPPLTEAELDWIQRGQRWRLRRGFHLLVQSAAPQSLAYGLQDAPAGLAGWLVEKYREWSDCGGDVERRFSKDDLCDFLTMYWATGTIASSMRLYWAERRDRWRLGPEDRIEVPAAAADFPGEIVRPPREWAERIFTDLRSWTEMPSGGHFAAFEEPELLASDIEAFLDELS